MKNTILYLTILALLPTFAETISLSGDWSLTYWPEPSRGAIRTLENVPHAAQRVPARVPGNCELDLVRAGILPPPEVGTNIVALRRYEGHQWLYERRFVFNDMRADRRIRLIFEGVDTLADYFLNGQKIGSSDNMHIPHTFDVTDCIRRGTNEIAAILSSVILSTRTNPLAECGTENELVRTRKASHMSGWDIMPRAMVSGLWRDVRLEVDGPESIEETAWMVRKTRPSDGHAVVEARVRIRAPFDRLDNAKVRFTLARNGKIAVSQKQSFVSFGARTYLTLSGAALWWPRGSGESALYDASVELLDLEGHVLASKCEKIGLRTIQLERDDVYSDKRPGQFLFRVNGEPCYIRGSNWVPLDALHGRDSEHLDATLALVKDLNCNMLRVWGGSVYESDAFYDWCDRNGVMVWQDFMTACNNYPQDDAYARATEEEVRAVVLRLRNHPSLALWSGNNENDQTGFPSIWRVWYDPNDDRNSRETIPRVLREFDMTRAYLPSSPYYSPDVAHGIARPSEDHLWGPRGYYKEAYYTNSPAWFVSEMGYHGCPNRASLERMMTPETVYPWKNRTSGFDWNDAWQLKACNPALNNQIWRNRNDLMTKQCTIMFGSVPRDLDAFIWQSQFIQAEAMKTICEMFRSRKFTRANGLIWWNVRDGWPIISDAVVDYYGGKKRAYAALKNAQQDQIVCLVDDGTAWAVNDARRAVSGSARFTDVASGECRLEANFTIPANGKIALGKISFSGQGVIRIEATLDGKPFSNHFLYGAPPFKADQIRKLID